jgi:uncharacterized protein DUF1707
VGVTRTGILVFVPEQSDNLRASDADRQRVADQLKAALDEGRLTLDEYDDRLREVFAARTYADLKPPLADLPAAAPVSRSQVEPAQSGAASPQQSHGNTRKWIIGMWSGWLSTSLIVTAIWLATWIAGGVSDVPYFWPIWVIGPWGAVILASTIGGLTQGQPHSDAQRRARREAERRQRRQQRRNYRRN